MRVFFKWPNARFNRAKIIVARKRHRSAMRGKIRANGPDTGQVSPISTISPPLKIVSRGRAGNREDRERISLYDVSAPHVKYTSNRPLKKPPPRIVIPMQPPHLNPLLPRKRSRARAAFRRAKLN